MPVTPTGTPGWSRQNDHTSLGGSLNKQNYLAHGSVDPRTDLTAQNFCRIVEDISKVALMMPMAVINASPTALVSGAYMYDGADPDFVHTATGVYTITFDESYSDSYGVSQDVDIKFATVTVSKLNSVDPYFGRYVLSDTTGNSKNNRIVVYIRDYVAALQDFGFTVEVD